MKCYIIVLILIHATNQESCGVADVDSHWIADDFGRLVFPIYNSEPLTVQSTSNFTFSPNETSPCEFDLILKNFICYGNLDNDFIQALTFTTIKNFIVHNYNTENISISDGEFRIDLADDAYKLAGQILSTDNGIGMHLSADIQPNHDYNGFIIQGDAYSNELRVGWRVEGVMEIFENDDSIFLNCTIITVDEGGWVFTAEGFLTDSAMAVDGTVDASLFLAPLPFKGILKIEPQEDLVWRISGGATVKPLLIIWNVQATVTPAINEHITIPRGLFQSSKIKHILFKSSTFMGDFDKDALQGISSLETITFLDSKLEEIPRLDFLLNNLTNLKAIYLDGSSMPDVCFGIYRSLPSLQLFSLKGSGPLQLNGASFSWLEGSNLTYLNFQDCNIKIKSKSEAILQPIGAMLRYLDLSYTSLTDPASLEAMLIGLQVTHLSLAGLQLTTVPKAALTHVSNTTEYLTFRGNVFHKVPEENMFSVIFDFPLMPKLKELDLKRCSINYIETGAFDQLPALQRLYLSYNDIENIQEGWYGIRPSVIQIDLSWNKINVVPEPTAHFSIKPGGGWEALRALEIVDLSNALFTYSSDIVKSLPNTTTDLSLCNIALPSHAVLEGLNLPEMVNLDLSLNPAIEFGSVETLKFLNSLTKLQKLHARRNRITNSFFTSIHDFTTSRNLTSFIETLQALNLSENNIKTLNANSFAHFPNLKIVDLTTNSIAAWTESLKLSPYMIDLKLSDNKIETMTNAMIRDLSLLKKLDIGRNPFQCDCGVQKLADAMNQGTGLCGSTLVSRGVFAIRMPKKKRSRRSVENCVKIMDWGDDFYCYQENGDEMTYLKNLNSSSVCVPEKIITAEVAADLNALYVITAVSLVIGVIIAFIYWKWWEIRLLTRAVRNAAILSFLDRKEEDAPPILYSAFVSYSDKDRSWVLQQLLPRLEEWSDVNVCLHERDFKVGISIMENITYSMERSRNLVLVLSQAFVMSQWCQFELHMAQHRFIESRRDRLVLVLLEPIPSYKRPKTLRYLMRTNTYLEWPGEQKSAEVARFWDRLLQSLHRDTI